MSLEKTANKPCEKRPMPAPARLPIEKFHSLLQKKRAVLVKSITTSTTKPVKVLVKDKKTLPQIITKDKGKKFSPADFDKPEILLAKHFPIERLIETNRGLLEQAKLSQSNDDINKLIRKLTLSFTAKKAEADFLVDSEKFEGAHFHVSTDENDLRLTITGASRSAKDLLLENQEILRDRLIKNEINLAAMTFDT